MKSNQVEQRRKMLSDAFHTLNQPLTGLHCGLEIALQKSRSEAEYRQRISSGLENAGAILQLIKAIRQLVDAADPGERFGTVNVSMLMAQLKSELEVVAEAAQVRLEIHDAAEATLSADPGKLISALGTLAAAEIERRKPGAVVEIETAIRKKWLDLSLRAEGLRKPAPIGITEKLAEIRRNAAHCYLWTLDAKLKVIDDDRWTISLPFGIKHYTSLPAASSRTSGVSASRKS